MNFLAKLPKSTSKTNFFIKNISERDFLCYRNGYQKVLWMKDAIISDVDSCYSKIKKVVAQHRKEEVRLGIQAF